MAISRDGKNVAFTTKAEAIRLWSFRLDAVTGRIRGAREPVGEGIDTATPAGRLQLHILGAIVEFERARIQERVRAGLARVRAQGRRLGRPRVSVRPETLEAVRHLSVREAAAAVGVSTATLKRLRRGSKSSAPAA